VSGSVYHAYKAEQEKRRYQKLISALEKQQKPKGKLSKKRVPTKTVKRLFAGSGNQCAFPECGTKLVNVKGVVVADIAHIEGEKPGSPRYNPDQSNVERFGYDNLILFCPSHHRLVDNDPTTYTVEVLRGYKKEHENSDTPKLQLAIENEQADRAIIVENPERCFQSNMLHIYLNNKSKDDVHNFEVRLSWPFEGFSTGLWDRTGNYSEKWESLPREKRYAHNETVHAGNRLLIGQILVRRFDGQTGKIKYKIYADKTEPIEGEIVINKEIDKNYLGR
jgi:hypothetical protein